MSDELEGHIQMCTDARAFFLWARIFKEADPGTAERLITALKVQVREARSSP